MKQKNNMCLYLMAVVSQPLLPGGRSRIYSNMKKSEKKRGCFSIGINILGKSFALMCT